jgi:signal transduction histidine kinase
MLAKRRCQTPVGTKRSSRWYCNQLRRVTGIVPDPVWLIDYVFRAPPRSETVRTNCARNPGQPVSASEFASPTSGATSFRRSGQMVALLAGAYAIAGGTVTLLGWALNIQRLTDWNNEGISMFANTAVCAATAGVALVLLTYRRGSQRPYVTARFLAAVVALIGCLTVYEHISGVNVGIDTLLFNRPWGQRASAAPMRMGPPASVSFMMLGIALLCATYGGVARRIGSWLALAVLSIVSLSLIGYLFNADQLYIVARYSGIALQTSTMLAVLSIGTMAAVPEHGIAAALRRGDAGGTMLRRLIVPIIVVPIVLGYLRIWGQEAGLYDTAFGTALRSIIEIVLFVALLWWTANSISRQASAARAAEQVLRENETQLAAETDALKKLNLASSRLWQMPDLIAGLDEMLAATIEMLGADMGNIQLLDAQQGVLVIAAQRGFRQDFLDFFREVSTADDSACGRALRSGERTIIDNIEADAAYAPYRPIARSAGYRAVQSTPLMSRDGQPLGMFSTHFGRVHRPSEQDLRRLDLYVRQAADFIERCRIDASLREADHRKDEFLATLAHELRNPLAPIRNALEIIKYAADDGEILEQARDMMERQLAHLVRLVDDLLDVSRITRDKLELRTELVELTSIVQQAVETCRSLVDESRHELHLTLPAEPIWVDADAVRLAQVFSNLLNNACKFTEPGGTIWLSAERQGNDVVVSVKDTGIGISTDKLDRIFAMFEQVDSRLERTRGGLGIGLTLAQRLVALHGGRLSARSAGLGHGSEFFVRLPIIVERSRLIASPLSSSKAAAATGQRILVVDDNQDAANSLARLLKLNGHVVHAAYDGTEALKKAEVHQPDVILLDIGLPKINGFDVCRSIRRAPWGSNVRIVALTGWGQDQDRRDTRDAGFDHHLVKPVHPQEIEKALTAATS